MKNINKALKIIFSWEFLTSRWRQPVSLWVIPLAILILLSESYLRHLVDIDKYGIMPAVIITIFIITIACVVFFTWKCGNNNVIRKKDPVFGKIEYCEGIWDSISFKNYSLSVEGDEDGPSEEQRHFYKTLEKNIDNHVQKAKQYLKEHVPDVDFAQYKLCSVYIGVGKEIKNGVFSLDFCIDKVETVYGVKFEQGKPISHFME